MVYTVRFDVFGVIDFRKWTNWVYWIAKVKCLIFTSKPFQPMADLPRGGEVNFGKHFTSEATGEIRTRGPQSNALTTWPQVTHHYDPWVATSLRSPCLFVSK